MKSNNPTDYAEYLALDSLLDLLGDTLKDGGVLHFAACQMARGISGDNAGKAFSRRMRGVYIQMYENDVWWVNHKDLYEGWYHKARTVTRICPCLLPKNEQPQSTWDDYIKQLNPSV